MVSSEEPMTSVVRHIWIRLADERGASMVEYALLLALIAITALVAVAFFGSSLSESFNGSTTDMFVSS